MAFINEFISSDDLVKYGIEAIDELFSKATFKSHWTVDLERDFYLREVAKGREDYASQSTWTFFWNDALITLVTDVRSDELPNGASISHYYLVRIDLPSELLEKRADILSDLKDALTARNSNGVYTTRPVSQTTFEF